MLESLAELGSVYGYEPNDFQEDPVATVTASSNEGDYRSTSENRRVFAYTIRLWCNQAKREADNAEEVLADLEDQVLELFDRYFTLGNDLNGNAAPGTLLTPPTGYSIVRVEAIPSAWFWVERGDSFRMAEVNLRVHVDVDVGLIT